MGLDTPQKKTEIGSVTILRGLAAVTVMLYHLFCVTKGYLVGQAVQNIFFFGKFGVQVFFVISGFVICHSMIAGNYTIAKFPVFILKRLIRVEPPYIIVVILTVGYILLRNHLGIGRGEVADPSLNQVLLHVGYLIPFSHFDWLSIVFWTLAIEFQFYLLFSFGFIAVTKGTVSRAIFHVGMILLMFLGQNDALFFYWSGIFLLGIDLALYKNKFIGKNELALLTVFLVATIFQRHGLVVMLASVLAFLFILWNPVISHTVLFKFGMISYSLYLCHTLIIFPIINLAFRFPQNPFNRVAFGTLSVIVTLCFSYLLYRWVEKPAKTYASNIRYT